MRRTQRACFVSGTWVNLKTQLRTYFLFCAHFKQRSLPADLETVLLYAQFLSRSFKAPQSIKNYLNGVKFLHILFGHEYQYTGNYMISLLFRGIERKANHVPQRAVPITPNILRSLSSVAVDRDIMDTVCFSACLILFFLMARAGNVFQEHVKDPTWVYAVRTSNLHIA